ncbi:MAG: PD-(D/E)XK nuclease family protein, partial [Candidatus Omnitrophica bacterium]|nr:PD-(D/E)XK nuclease family protein [Candidatus Omnitrophota bacterium]
MSRQITASMLYDLVQCEKRVELDNSGDPSLRDKINPFIQMLWDRGALFEKETIQQLEMPFEDLSAYSLDIKEQKTYEAMDRKDALIYGGRISSDELLGDPDLLKLEGDKYIAGDIKSGGAEDVFDDDRKPKQHYAAQVALYTDILERKGYSAGRKAFIWDIHGDEVVYDLNMSRGSRIKQTMWEEYVSLLNNAKLIIQNGKTAKGALASKCKMCYWYSVCSKDLAEKDDLTLIPELGRALRDCMEQDFPTVQQLSESNPDNYIRGRKTTIKGLGPDRLVRFHKRAELLKSKHPKPEVITPVSLPKTECEIFFDIEVDPMRDVCYLHGFIERDGNGEKFHAFYADNPTAEEEKFAFQ